VLIFQQTAANLHVGPGDRVAIARMGLPPVSVRVDGVIGMPEIDSFFQAVGLPPGAAPQAPPDNVIVLPESLWHRLFDRQSIVRPDSVREQYHVRVAHALPADPLAAYDRVTASAKNVEARIAGSGIVGDNLAAKLLGTQADALYARVLFLFLGIPGAVLAIVLTFAVAGSGNARRRREQALLRVRGASTRQILALAGVEAGVVAFAGVALGAAGALTGGLAAFDSMLWIVIASGVGLVVAALAVLVPAWTQSRDSTVVRSRADVGRAGVPLWQRLYLDLACLAVSGIAFWQIASSGYQVVLAPEGVPQTSVHYQAFLAPLFLWIGAALLVVRVWRLVLLHGRTPLAAALRPVAGPLGSIVAASLGRQHALVTSSVLTIGLAFSFGVSTAVFNATFDAQARVDAQLTNGSDVTVIGSTSAPPSRFLAQLRSLRGVAAAEPMQHRFAYVGSDLQDLYGIDPNRIGAATPMSNAFFGNADAPATLAELARTPDGVLVSEETVQTYQLHLGDTLVLRLQDAKTQKYRPVTFHFVGITREFPSAPKDSFLVANAGYVAARTGTDAAEIVLMRVPGDLAGVSKAARSIVASLPGATVVTIAQAQTQVGSSLTSIDLHGLTAIELIFAIVFAAAATGLMLALGFAERRRTFGILAAIGATPHQLGAFLWSEAAIGLVGGGIFGIALGLFIAQMLVKVLTGVFDPPPEVLTIPWAYLGALVTAAILSTAIATVYASRAARLAMMASLRAL
jgi:putative ABC transport system permease protein